MIERDIPHRVGRYRIDGILGEGAMAVVYAGFDPDIERHIAIKCLHGEIAADPAFRRRFLVEARAAGQLTHPHIVTIFDAGETDDGVAFIAMERLSGETLASRVAREGFPPLPVIMDLVGQIAGALDYAHAQGVVHHDIKPENIMLTDGWQHAKVNDFGIAERRAIPSVPGRPLTEVGGTPAYMAPEHLRGQATDGRSDLFSLGVVLYWLVSSKLPWPETDDVEQLLRERERVPMPSIQVRDPATPSILLDVVATLLLPAASARYQHGAEIVADLQLARREYAREHDNALASRLISLRLRWVGILAAVLTLTLLLGLATIYTRQGIAVTGLALDFGSSMGRMVAGESAENLLLGDRAATRALVESIARNQQIDYLAVADRYDQVVASTLPDQVGHRLPALTGQHLARIGDIDSFRSHAAPGTGGQEMLLFAVPVRYQTAAVGALRLGVSTAPLRAAQKATLWVIIAVLIVTLAAVVGAAYWLSRRLLALLDVLGAALLRVAHGDFHYRIRLVRRDELGRLFATFNLMTGALQKRDHRQGKADGADLPEDVSRPTRIIPVIARDDDRTGKPD
ncbi:MAG: protein kinase [Rhodanobacter sp.]